LETVISKAGATGSNSFSATSLAWTDEQRRTKETEEKDFCIKSVPSYYKSVVSSAHRSKTLKNILFPFWGIRLAKINLCVMWKIPWKFMSFLEFVPGIQFFKLSKPRVCLALSFHLDYISQRTIFLTLTPHRREHRLGASFIWKKRFM